MSEGQSPPIIGEGGADIGGAPRGLSACMEAPVAFVEMSTELSTNVKDFLDFGFLEDLLVPSLLLPCALLRFFAPLVVLALLPLLLSLQLCVDELEALWVVSRPTSLWRGRTILTDPDRDVIKIPRIFFFFFFFF